MATLKRRIVDREEGRYWAVYGPGGVISWALLLTERGRNYAGPIGVHSPRPQWEDDEKPSGDCPFLEGACYVDSGYLAGGRLGDAWDAAGRDDDVIWRELSAWYAGRLAGDAS